MASWLTSEMCGAALGKGKLLFKSFNAWANTAGAALQCEAPNGRLVDICCFGIV